MLILSHVLIIVGLVLIMSQTHSLVIDLTALLLIALTGYNIIRINEKGLK